MCIARPLLNLTVREEEDGGGDDDDDAVCAEFGNREVFSHSSERRLLCALLKSAYKTCTYAQA